MFSQTLGTLGKSIKALSPDTGHIKDDSPPRTAIKILAFVWCPEPDLNRHDRNDRGILSPLCLPISPPGQGDEIEGGEAYHANAQSKAPEGQ